MVNDDILTALKNAVDHGESLELAKQIAVNSGYNPSEVEEASRFVKRGAISSFEPKPDEHLAMPEKKSFFSRFQSSRKSNVKPIPPTQTNQQIKESIITPSPQARISNELSKIKPPKDSYTKEIILLIILLSLIAVLVAVIMFKDNLLSFFSG